MNIVTSINEWRLLRSDLGGQTMGFVPTMGHLHAGHLSLCERSRAENALTVVSIFVNPTQFNQASDFDHYPPDVERDAQLLRELEVDFLLLPDVSALYPDQYSLQIFEQELALDLEGTYRPGYFSGMLTVVLKLLNLVQASKAYFGEKGYQQYLLIKKMAESLFSNTEIVACPTLSAEDGLALSSRNVRLNHDQRYKAACFPKILQQAENASQAQRALIEAGFKVDYVADQWGRRLAAIWIDDVRLIDNIEFR